MLMPHSRRLKKNGAQTEYSAVADVPNVALAGPIPFAQRLTCTIAQACEVTGLGRTKPYELIGDGQVSTTTVGRRRLVLVQSLPSLLKGNR
jgi:excisionase family DNA binding protein